MLESQSIVLPDNEVLDWRKTTALIISSLCFGLIGCLRLYYLVVFWIYSNFAVSDTTTEGASPIINQNIQPNEQTIVKFDHRYGLRLIFLQ